MTETILLVEDSEDDVFFMKRAFKVSGLKSSLQVAPDGRTALDYLSGEGDYADREKYPIPSLLLLDLKLPYVLGLDVLKWIRMRPELQMLPVVVLTSSSEPSDLERAYRHGANSFMVKPSDPDELIGLVRCLHEYWFKYNVIPHLE